MGGRKEREGGGQKEMEGESKRQRDRGRTKRKEDNKYLAVELDRELSQDCLGVLLLCRRWAEGRVCVCVWGGALHTSFLHLRIFPRGKSCGPPKRRSAATYFT